MNMRQHKRHLCAAQMSGALSLGRYLREMSPRTDWVGYCDQELIKLAAVVIKAVPMPAATGKVNVRRKKDGVVVGTDMTPELAEEMVAKAKAGKKAALEIC
jgi:hypothetical protein